MTEKLQIRQLGREEKPPFELLEMADPSRKMIDRYLETGQCYVGRCDGEVRAALVLLSWSSSLVEVMNIAVAESHQGQGYGKQMLRFARSQAIRSGHSRLRICTGNSSLAQLALYQKVGFEIVDVRRGYFLEHYPEPIFENGIQCKDQMVLEMEVA